jgi:serine carboxypeptidase-like clade 2
LFVLSGFSRLESPAGVGFSFSKNPNDYNGVGDARTANDTFVFLQTFFRDLFPQFRSNPFYVTGESYGGHYVPTACQRVFEGNDRREGVQINLRGMIEGNAWTNMRKLCLFFSFFSHAFVSSAQDNLGALETWVERAISPRVLVEAVKQHCNLSYVGPLHRRDDGCNAAINAAMESFNYVDIYDIYADVVMFFGLTFCCCV